MRRTLNIALAIVVLYGLAWLFGDHEMTYAVQPATRVFANEWTCPDGHSDESKCDVEPTKQIVEKWVCDEDDEGPFRSGNLEPYECHSPVTSCPLLWFPIASESPCPYRDPLEHQ
jgi:hypothetical protein